MRGWVARNAAVAAAALTFLLVPVAATLLDAALPGRQFLLEAAGLSFLLSWPLLLALGLAARWRKGFRGATGLLMAVAIGAVATPVVTGLVFAADDWSFVPKAALWGAGYAAIYWSVLSGLRRAVPPEPLTLPGNSEAAARRA